LESTDKRRPPFIKWEIKFLDADSNGIGDVPYNVTGSAGSQDIFPLMECPISVQDGEGFPLELIILILIICGTVIGLTTLLLIRRKRKRKKKNNWVNFNF